MSNLAFIIIISLAAIAIIIIIIRHFPALAVLDADNIPEEKERQVKEKLIKNRINRKFSFFNKLSKKIINLSDRIYNFFQSKLLDLQKKNQKIQEEEYLFNASLDEKNKVLFSQVEELLKNENWEEAEKKLIDIISLDDKNFSAFFKLGEVYQSEEKWQEAKQTLLYANKLAEVFPKKVSSNEVSNLNYSLALINKELDDLNGAKDNLLKSLEIDPNNPRYLDLMLDLCIIKKEKYLALKYLDKIKEINPDNNNILEWEEKINDLE